VTVVGVGIDLVDLERIRTLLANKGEHAMARFFWAPDPTRPATPPPGSRRRKRSIKHCRPCRAPGEWDGRR
jgi:hypothetical protein